MACTTWQATVSLIEAVPFVATLQRPASGYARQRVDRALLGAAAVLLGILVALGGEQFHAALRDEMLQESVRRQELVALGGAQVRQRGIPD